MYKFLYAFAVVIFLASCGSDADNGNTTSSQTDTVFNKKLAAHEYAVYLEAIKKKDIVTATYAINSYLKLDSSKKDLLDSLVYLYYDMKNPIACGHVVNEVLKLKPNDSIMLEIGSECDESVGKFEEAIVKYNKMYEITRNLRIKYKIALLKYNMADIDGGDLLMNELTLSEEAKTTIISLPADNQGKTVDVKLNVAAYYSKGIVNYRIGKTAEAVAAFRKCLDLDPQFEPAPEMLNKILYRK